MSGILHIEFQRAFKNPRLWLIPVLALVGFWVGYQQYFMDFVLEGASPASPTGYGCSGIPTHFFVYLAPLLAAIPYSDSLIIDRRYGFLKNVLTRCRFSHYLTAKALANMAAGALAGSIPGACNSSSCFLVVKGNAPILTVGDSQIIFPNIPMGALGSLFPAHAGLYLGCLVVLAALFGAAYATFGLAVSAWVNNRYAAMAAPFAFMVVLGYLADRSLHLAIIGHPAGTFLPFRYGMSWVQISGQFLGLALVFLVSFAVYARKTRNQRLA
jgi:hypothetical protein